MLQSHLQMWTGNYGFTLRKLVRKDFTVRYRNMSLGVFWSLLNPIVMVAILTFVFTRVMPSSVDNFPVFVLCGLVPFTFFTQTWGIATASVVENAGLVKRTRAPRELIPVASVLANSLNLAMQFGLLIVLVILRGGEATVHWLWLPVLGILEVAFVCGLALFSSALNVYVRDTRYAVESINAITFWLVPIFYSFSTIPDRYRNVYQFNPLAALTLALRNIFLDGHSPAGSLLWKLTLVSLVTLGSGWVAFRRLKPHFYDYL